MARSLSLSLAFLGEYGEIGAPLDPTLLVPRALAVPDEDDSLRGLDRRERSRSVQLGAELALFLLELLEAGGGGRGGRGGSDCEEGRIARVWSGSGGGEEEEEARVSMEDESGGCD